MILRHDPVAKRNHVLRDELRAPPCVSFENEKGIRRFPRIRRNTHTEKKGRARNHESSNESKVKKKHAIRVSL